VWDMQRKTTIKIIPPVPRPVSFSAGRDGHAFGAKIIHISFIGSRHDLISGDSDVSLPSCPLHSYLSLIFVLN
jgi:hypothetical protein